MNTTLNNMETEFEEKDFSKNIENKTEIKDRKFKYEISK